MVITDKLALEIINLGTETGADFVEIYAEDSTQRSLLLDSNVIENVSNGDLHGCGIRLLKGTRSVFGYTNDVSRKGLTDLVTELSAAYHDTRVVDKIDHFKVKKHTQSHLTNEGKNVPRVEDPEAINYMKKASEIVYAYDPRIIRVIVSFQEKVQNFTVYNSDGVKTGDTNHHYWYILQTLAFENGKMETRADTVYAQTKALFVKKMQNLEAFAQNNAEKVILMLGAKECPSGRFPVIIGNGWGGVIFHESCGHQLEASAVSKGMSIFTGMKGQKIANDIVTAYDDGTLLDEWGSNNIDDEGNETQKNCLIKDGTLVGYMIDSFNGRRMGEKANGCCRRESYKYEPTSRMSNTYIANGTSTKEEIIANTKLAVYCVGFNGGSVDPATGDFNFGVSEAYIVKDGKITEPVRGAILVGNGKDILKHIDMIADDCAFGSGMCGAASGSIPVNVGQPTIRVDEITVGGRGGSIDEF